MAPDTGLYSSSLLVRLILASVCLRSLVATHFWCNCVHARTQTALWLSVDTAHKHACPHTHTHPHTQADGVRVCVCIRDVYFCKLMCGLPWRHIVLSPRQQSPDVETRCDTKMKETVSSSFNNTFKEWEKKHWRKWALKERKREMTRTGKRKLWC